MSAFGGKADVIQDVVKCPLIAISGHWDALAAATFKNIGMPVVGAVHSIKIRYSSLPFFNYLPNSLSKNPLCRTVHSGCLARIASARTSIFVAEAMKDKGWNVNLGQTLIEAHNSGLIRCTHLAAEILGGGHDPASLAVWEGGTHLARG